MDADLRPPRAHTGLADLAREATQHTSTLLRDEMALAKVELKEDIQTAVAGISLFTGAGVAALLAVVMLSAAAAFGLGQILGEDLAWAGFALVGVAYLLIAGVAALIGKRKVAQVPPPLERSTRQVERDVEAVKEIRR